MKLTKAFNLVIGLVILVSLALAHFAGQINIAEDSWLWLTTFVGVALFQAGFTGFCPVAMILKKLGAKE